MSEEVKVKAVEFKQESIQERERKLAGNTIQQAEVHKIKLKEEDKKPENKKPEEKPQELELNDNKILEYFEKNHNKKLNSLDELLNPKTVEPELPEDVKTFWEFKKETNRGLKDFMAAQEDIDSLNEDEKLKKYYSSVHPTFNDEDISTLVSKFSYDEDLDDESEVKEKKLNKKLELEKANKFLTESKKKYSTKLESSVPNSVDPEEFKSWKKAQEDQAEKNEVLKKKREVFLSKTNEFFSDKFNGFEIEISEDSKINFNPGEKDKLIKDHSNTSNFFNKFLNKETGELEDAKGFHTALAVGMNFKEFAKACYEQGVADQVKRSKAGANNIDMSGRSSFANSGKKGEGKVREVSAPRRRSPNSLTIKPFN